MKHILLLILFLSSLLSLQAQELARAITDKDCYLTGERLHIRVDVTDTHFHPSTLSKVAYVELTDEHRICAQGMVKLTDGRGWADIALPASMHSGNYQLSVYTRVMRNWGQDKYFRKLISIVNPLRVVRADRITYLPADSFPSSAAAATMVKESAVKECTAGSSFTVQLQPEWRDCAVSLTRIDLQTPSYDQLPELKPAPENKNTIYIPEAEGHIAMARATSAKTISQTQLVMVGRMAVIFDGQWQPDGTWLYYTNDLCGTLPTVINSYDIDGNPVGMEFVSPFAKVLPQTLPALQVYCSEEDLQRRSLSAQREQAITDWLGIDSLALKSELLSSTPHHSYDLDEYTKFSTVREILIEFIRGVHREKVNGVNQLFTFDNDEHQYSRWPALVLLDGMPVHNIDDILSYDARLLKYVHIYTDRYTFGSTICKGIISFISQRGRLSNYKIDAGSKFVSYQFPQNRPDFIYPAENNAGTLYWNPCITGQNHSLTLPSSPGRYQLSLQYIANDGSVVKKTEVINVK